MSNIYNSKEYKRSRAAYALQCTFEYFVHILIADAFLAKLLSSIGISDALIGIISSFVTLAFLFQLSAVFLVNKIKNTKKAAIFFSTTSQVLFMCLYLVPFLSVTRNAKTIIVILFVLGAYFTNYFIASILFKWANSYVSPSKRAEFSATKEMVSLLSGVIFTFISGMVVDHFEAQGNVETAFLIIAGTIFVLCVLNFISLMLVKGKNEEEEEKRKIPLKEVFENTLGNKNFVNVIILTCLWDIARYITVGFLGIYKTKDLLLSVGTVQIINMAGNLGRFLLSKPFGRYSDRHSYIKGIKLALIIAATAFAVNMFTSPSTKWFIIIYTILYTVSFAGTNQNSMNIVYSYVKSDYFVHATAIKNSIGGIFGFAATLIGSKIVSMVQAAGNTVFGVTIYAQQILSGISFIILIITILFIKFVMEKQEIMKQ